MPSEHKVLIDVISQHIHQYSYWYVGGFVLSLASTVFYLRKSFRGMDREIKQAIEEYKGELVDIIANTVNIDPGELDRQNTLKIAGYLMSGIKHPSEVIDELREPYKAYVHAIIDAPTFQPSKRGDPVETLINSEAKRFLNDHRVLGFIKKENHIAYSQPIEIT